MLRIEIYQNTKVITFTLAGKLKGPCVLELARC